MSFEELEDREGGWIVVARRAPVLSGQGSRARAWMVVITRTREVSLHRWSFSAMGVPPASGMLAITRIRDTGAYDILASADG